MRSAHRPHLGASNQGLGMVYFMIFAAVVGIIGVGINSMMSNNLTSIKIAALKTTRDALYERLNAVSGVEAAITASLNDPVNGALRACVVPNSGGCANYNPPAVGNFRLWTPLPASVPVAGMAGNDVYYDENGRPCAAANCRMFMARAHFFASCAVASPCPTSENVYATVQITYVGPVASASTLTTNTGLNFTNRGMTQYTIVKQPSDHDMLSNSSYNKMFSTYVNTNNLQCNPNSAMINIVNGQVTCACINGNPSGTDANGLPLCDPPPSQTCGIGFLFMGYDAHGPNCLPMTPDSKCWSSAPEWIRYDCDMTTGCNQTTNLTIACGSQGGGPYRLRGLQSVVWGACQAGNGKKKKGYDQNFSCWGKFTYQCCPAT